MARKSIKGYAEKNYYDNTRFGGGIVATNDPLNEGYFKSLVNFDISDTGYSLQPRKGFFTTTFKIKDVTYILSNETIYFYDANIGKHIFIDFKQVNTEKELPLIILADFDIDEMYLTNAKICTNFDWSSVKAYLESVTIDPRVTLFELKFVQPKAELAVDKYGIPKYIVKVKYVYTEDGGEERTFEFWVSFVYREKGTKYENETYSANTLVMEYIDFTDTVSINMADRNIASAESIIPNPLQKVYNPSEEIPSDFIQQFPLIYAKQNINSTPKYLINTYNNLEDITIIPHYTLDTPADNYKWYYSYDIISMDKNLDNNYEDNTTVHHGDIYELDTHSNIHSILTNTIHASTSWLTLYNYLYNKRNNFNKYETTKTGEGEDLTYKITSSVSASDYESYLDDLDFKETMLTDSTYAQDSIIIYVVPNLPESTLYGKHYHTINNENDFLLSLKNSYNTSDIDTGSLNDMVSYKTKYIGKYVLANKNSTDWFQYHACNMYGVKRLPYLSDILRTDNNFDSIDVFLKELKSKILKIVDVASINDVSFFWAPVSNLSNIGTLQDINHSVYALNSRVYISRTKGYSFEELKTFLKSSNYNTMYVRTFNTLVNYQIHKSITDTNLKKLFPVDTDKDYTKFKMYIDLDPYYESALFLEPDDVIGDNTPDFTYRNCKLYNRIFKEYNKHTPVNKTKIDYYSYDYTPLIENRNNLQKTMYSPGSNNPFTCDTTIYYATIGTYTIGTVATPSVFYTSNNLVCTNTERLKSYLTPSYFTFGVSLVFYLFQAPIVTYLLNDKDLMKTYFYDREYLVNSTNLKQLLQLMYSSTPPTTIVETLTEEPGDISSASNSLIFRSTQGDHLVLYKNNKLYISEANNQHYFKYTKTFSYPEQIVKVIQYKDTLLVFTTQNLYSVYPIEVTENVESGIDAEGNKQYTQVTTIEYGSLPVLYNLLVNEKYKDAIQVYNQMVLFYSADGQMFMIKPTATIDSNTRFSIQYFNKNANDILLNYTDYIRDRLRYYGYEIDDSIEQALNSITIKVSVSLNNIKIFYCVPGIMTYILVYDIINNRYYVYDTLSFTNVKHLEFIPEGELYIVEHEINGIRQLYFTQPYVLPLQKNNNVDLSYFHSFTPEPIVTELDTGIENLNNHLKKRFRDLHIIYKNISAETLEFSLDVFVDNIPIITYINPEIQVQDSMYTVNDVYKTSTLVDLNRQMLDNNNALFDFSQFNSSKILTHKTSIISRGKTIRTKLCFKSDGIYKIQGYGLIYKEHTV